MNLTLLKQPYEISFAGNPLQFIWQVAPYGTAERGTDVTVTVRVLVENIYGSEQFEEVYLQKLYPTDDGKVQLDVSAIVSPYLKYCTPRTDLSKPIECIGQRKRYQVTTVIQYQGMDILPPIYVDPVYYYAIKGGLAYEAWHYKEFFTKKILQDKMPLLFSAAKELVDPQALRFFYWIYPFGDNAAQTISYKIYLSDGNTVSFDNPYKLNSGNWSVNCVPAGFIHTGLSALLLEGKSPIKYSIKISTATQTIVEEYFFNLDNRNFYEPYFLLYRNSIGGLETVRLLGQTDIASDYARQQARRTIAPAWYGQAQLTNEITEETLTFTADTGFMSKEQLLKLRDLFLSKEIYQVGDSLTPVVITSNKIKFFSNKDSLVSTSIEFQQAFINSFFTPRALMPNMRICPALEIFKANQTNKSTLQFLWSLEDPYDNIEVQVIIGANSYTYSYKGNNGMVSQSFDNPGAIASITVKARCICNADAIPVDYGPHTILSFPILGSALPVAIDDRFQVPAGTTEILLPTSALANDYDPDGGHIQAIFDSGIMASGISWQIDVNGLILLRNIRPNFSGTDSFEYRIHRIGSSDMVAARVYITVGNGPQSVFVKWVYRNQRSTSQYTWAEAWLDFFSDPACTVPVDVTRLGLTIRATEERKNNGNVDHHEDYNFSAIGTKKLMWSGYTWSNFYPGPLDHWQTKFTVLPGAGYMEVN